MRIRRPSGAWLVWIVSVLAILTERLIWADPGESATEVLAIVLFGAVGAVILGRHPGHALARTWLAITVWYALVGGGATYASIQLERGGDLVSAGFAAWPAIATWIVFFTVLLVHTLLLFPDGIPTRRGWRVVYTLSWVNAAIGTVASGIWPDLLRDQDLALDNPFGIESMAGFAEGVMLVSFGLVGIFMVAALASLVLRYRRSGSDVRHQIRWFAYAAGVVAVVIVPYIGMEVVGEAVFGIAIAGLPVAMGVAILKYRLYDIDVVISKTVVFAGLAAFITAIYVGIVVGVGSLLGAGDEPNLALSIVATGVVAVAFQPVRERLTRLANRLVFGKRATPYEVLSTFSSHLAEVAAPEQTLERMARLLVDGTGAARAQVWLRVSGELRSAATWPSHATDGAAPEHRVEVTHEGEALGALSIDKQRGEQLTPTDVKLVDDLAAQAGLVLRNLKLTQDLRAKIVDLQASRQRLVAAQDAERRRLERDLHDGAQRQLLELKSQLSAASSIAATERAEKAGQILEQVAADADDAVATLRELAHGIFPPLLAAEGLAGALRGQAARAAVPVTVETDGVRRYPQDVEAAVYFCILEAIQNAAKYAEPTQVTVRLAHTDGHLNFEVSDDGTGFDPTTTPKGHGTTNMTDRLDALNGRLHIASEPGRGTRIDGRVPALPLPTEVGA